MNQIIITIQEKHNNGGMAYSWCTEEGDLPLLPRNWLEWCFWKFMDGVSFLTKCAGWITAIILVLMALDALLGFPI